MPEFESRQNISSAPLLGSEVRPSLWWFLLPLVLAGGWLLPLLVEPKIALSFVKEDGPFETASAALFFGAGILLLVSWSKRRQYANSMGLLLLGLLFIFTSGEEISWGQRIFNWSTPAGYANVQGETTIHNHPWFDKQTAGRLSMSHFFEAFCIGYGFLLPLVERRSALVTMLLQRWGVPLIPLAIGAAFPVNLLLSKLYQRMFDAQWILRVSELREWAHALVWFAIACVLYSAVRRRRAKSPISPV
ncbi:MAG: hypothetical protein ABJF50_20810 [Paracoccaceae bacterium]